MKRFVISIIVLSVIIAMCTIALFDLNKSIKDITKELDALEAAANKNDLPQADRLSKEFYNSWLKRERRLSLYLNHSLIDQVTWSASMLQAYLASKELGEYLAQVSQMRAVVNHIYDIEMPSIYNMF